MYSWDGGTWIALVVSLVETTKRDSSEESDVTIVLTHQTALTRGTLTIETMRVGNDEYFSWSVDSHGAPISVRHLDRT